jgi:hypothetical protein
MVLGRVPRRPAPQQRPLCLRPFGEISVGNHTQWSAFNFSRTVAPYPPVSSADALSKYMAKNGIAKRSGDSPAEPNSILRVVSIEEAVREYLRGEPRTLRLLLERLCDAVEGEEAEKVEAKIGA